MLRRRRIRDLGPLGWLALGVALVVAVMAIAGLAGWRLPVEASRPSWLILTLIGGVLLVWAVQRVVREARGPGPADRASPAKFLLLISLSMACMLLSQLLGPR
jgi:threonine/homoserine/homoserine lactone efflux protein